MGKAMLTLLAATAMSGTARAENFDFTIGGALTASGTLFSDEGSNGVYAVTGISGTADGQAITGLAPTGSYGGNDNLLAPDNARQLTFNGFTFLVGDVQYNVYYGTQESNLPGYRYSSQGSAAYDVSFNATRPGAAAVPEAATWAAMVAGLGAVGAAMRRRRAAVAFA